MDISIVIVNFRSEGLVRECIKEFLSLPSPLNREIIVVDNSPENRFEEVLAKRFPHVKYLSMEKNVGLAKANNAGARMAQGEYIFLCNPDILPHENALEELHTYLMENSHVGLVGPQLLSPLGSTQESVYRFYNLPTPLYRRTWLGKTWFGKRNLQHFLMRDKDLRKAIPVDWLQGSALLTSKKDYVAAGMMDENLFLYMEDTDLCRNYWHNNKEVHYVPSAKMTHIHNRQSAHVKGIKALADTTMRIHISSALYYFKKHGIKPYNNLAHYADKAQ